MAVGIVRVTIAQLPELQAIIFAAVDLLAEVEDADPALITDGARESAQKLRDALEGVR